MAPPGFISFDVSESNANWPSVLKWIEERGLGEHWVRTVFTKAEIREARWLQLQSDWHHGYPQPEDGYGYTRTTYDADGYCPLCGIEGPQRAPFVMAGEPRWGTRSILQLNWVFDEFFVTPDLAGTVFAEAGIGSRPVLNRRGSPLRTVVQLVVNERVSIQTRGLPFETCPRCGRRKYLPISRGPLAALIAEPIAEMARTDEVFGSGGDAFNAVVVSRKLARALTVARVRGVGFAPVAQTTGIPALVDRDRNG
jgi:hypothetical protein